MAGTFGGCLGLTQVILTNGLELIGPFMFHGATALTSLVIPSTVTYIGIIEFRDLYSLITIL